VPDQLLLRVTEPAHHLRGGTDLMRYHGVLPLKQHAEAATRFDRKSRSVSASQALYIGLALNQTLFVKEIKYGTLLKQDPIAAGRNAARHR